MAIALWTEKYRPQTLDDFVWRDPQMRADAERWVGEGALPHLLFAGKPGTGKTSLARLLFRLLDIPVSDLLEINASRERQIDTIQGKVVGFVNTWALGPTGIKYILLDEADSMSPLAQRMLRGEIEKYSDICRFVLTCNYAKNLIEPITSRFIAMHFMTLDYTSFTYRAADVLDREQVRYAPETLVSTVNVAYPDLRKCINLLQVNSRNGVLTAPEPEQEAARDWLLDSIALFRENRLLEARRLIIEQAQVEEYPGLYRFLYENLGLFGSTQKAQDNALLIIRDGLLNAERCGDPEINLAATLVQLTRVKESSS